MDQVQEQKRIEEQLCGKWHEIGTSSNKKFIYLCNNKASIGDYLLMTNFKYSSTKTTIDVNGKELEIGAIGKNYLLMFNGDNSSRIICEHRGS